ncbi:DUF438 domain-containing protein [Pontiellaceae bacterium B1224]|nr:DUF438 domain-containing protein [Pontiellaceae bacterium B1224]
MSELINNAEQRRELLKHMIQQLHEGVAPEQVKRKVAELLTSIPHGDVVVVEQELIAEGLPEAEILKLCDLHHQVLDGNLDNSQSASAPKGHPVDTFTLENQAIKTLCADIEKQVVGIATDTPVDNLKNGLIGSLNQLMDADKHYRRKENLLFPFLEKNDITGPPKVMWGKHDEIREQVKGAIAALREADRTEEISALSEMLITPLLEAVVGMTLKEEQILFPMCMDLLTDSDWYDIYRQTAEIGYCLIDPDTEWNPEGMDLEKSMEAEGDCVRLPSGSFTPEELEALLNILPIDITFVDRNDKVKYFSQGDERIFDRNRAILGRDVRMCHPPSSTHIVEQIVEDFKAGRQDCAPFWIQMGDTFVHIAYYAMRDKEGTYLGTVEMSQNIAPLRALEGEQRILSYADNTES